MPATGPVTGRYSVDTDIRARGPCVQVPGRRHPGGYGSPSGSTGGRAHEIASNKRSCARYAGAGRVQTGPGRRRGTPAQATGGWAICCSGGGIRSAAYCLGALQSLDRSGLLAKVKWILGVSGRQLHRRLPCAGGAQSAAGGKAARLRARQRGGAATCGTTPATSRLTGRRCWSASCRCCSGRW